MAFWANRSVVCLSSVGAALRMHRKMQRNGAWYRSPLPIALCDSMPETVT